MEKMINKCIEKICEKNNIYGEVSMVSTKFNTDRLFFANNYVIKIYPDQKEKYFLMKIIFMKHCLGLNVFLKL